MRPAHDRIGVMLVDDSATMRQVLSEVLAREPDLEVIATASDPLFAMEKMARRWPDVLVLDIEMPRMDGLTFLRKLMAERPTPVVICSSLTARGADKTMQALAAGALGIVCKPTSGLGRFLEESGPEIAHAVRAAAQADGRRLRPRPARRTPVGAAPLPKVVPADAASPRGVKRIIALGASTGGTQALEQVLVALPRHCPGVVVVQHMPEKFTAAFATRLDALCEIQVREARDGDEVLPGVALIAPGGRQLQLRRLGTRLLVEVNDAPPVNRHRPSVDVLFQSVARCAGRQAVGVIMTGMGDDGARGLLAMREAGAATFAQDEASCVVYGMPKEAVKLGAAERSLPLAAIAREALRAATGEAGIAERT